MKQYACGVCGSVYRTQGTSEDEKAEGIVPFSELPEEWECVCGASKDDYLAIDAPQYGIEDLDLMSDEQRESVLLWCLEGSLWHVLALWQESEITSLSVDLLDTEGEVIDTLSLSVGSVYESDYERSDFSTVSAISHEGLIAIEVPLSRKREFFY